MEAPKIYHQFDPPPYDGEVNSGEEIVEKAGYIPADIQISEMIMAGERLMESRKERFDYQGGEEDDGMVDPTRRLDVDMAEMSMLGREVKTRLDEQERVAKASEEAKAREKKAPDGSA